MTLPVATIAVPVATVPTRLRSRVRRASIRLQPPVTPVTGWSEVRVVRVMRLHLLFKATAQCAKPVRQVRSLTPVLAPPAPRVVPVLLLPTLPPSLVHLIRTVLLPLAILEDGSTLERVKMPVNQSQTVLRLMLSPVPAQLRHV